jgi:hypothetical protein
MFRAPMTLDRMHRTLTVVVSGACALAAAASLKAIARTGSGAFGGIGIVVVLAVVLVFAWAMSPRELVVDAGELRVIRRAWPPVRVPLRAVASASPLDRFGGGAIRLFGVGGFFGSYGLFTSKGLGRFHLYSTRRGQAMIVRRRDGIPLVLTPDDVAGAIRAIDDGLVSLPAATGLAPDWRTQ